VTPRVAPATADLRVGVEGMTLIEYIGASTGRMTWFGPVTHARYVYSGSRRVAYVDRRDVPEMLQVRMDRRPAFRVYTPPETIAPETVTPETVDEGVV